MTASPARIKASFTVDLERPRNVEEIRMTAEFIAMYREVWSSLSSEVAIARQAGASRVA
jgi:NitT/TauT family transport system ATP-binding protein